VRSAGERCDGASFWVTVVDHAAIVEGDAAVCVVEDLEVSAAVADRELVGSVEEAEPLEQTSTALLPVQDTVEACEVLEVLPHGEVERASATRPS
jgi:hypothetical protein